MRTGRRAVRSIDRKQASASSRSLRDRNDAAISTRTASRMAKGQPPLSSEKLAGVHDDCCCLVESIQHQSSQTLD